MENPFNGFVSRRNGRGIGNHSQQRLPFAGVWAQAGLGDSVGKPWKSVFVRRASDVDAIIEFERFWQHLAHGSIDSYYRLLNDDGLISGFVAETETDKERIGIVGFVIFHIAAD